MPTVHLDLCQLLQIYHQQHQNLSLFRFDKVGIDSSNKYEKLFCC